MKTIINFFLGFTIFLLSSFLKINAQNNYEDVVYLKNGSVVRGVILEQIINVSVKIQTIDRNIFVYKIEEVEKITKEPTQIKKEEKEITEKAEIKTSDGIDFVQGNKYLLKQEVEIILRDSKNGLAYQYWVEGQRKNRTGNTLSWIGSPLMLVGAAATIGFAVDGALPPFIIMCIAVPTGATFLISGVSIKWSGRKQIINSINAYNSSLYSSYVPSPKPKYNLQIGLNQSAPGIGISLKF